MNNQSSSRERASIDRREFIKDAAVASLAASLGLQPFRTGSSALLAAQPASDGLDVAQS
ncbi:MAG: twin-arginine translocation signal domain-containing protein, partial [Thermoguttaceae bacterium]|nr:twin-arginine translocation signal domain-containing protein [Thermoguttaceae bacterium]